MAQKNKTKGSGKLDAVAAVRRSLARQDYKQALKDARAAWRRQPTAEVRMLLEEAYIQRVKQLLRFGMTAEARSTFEDLLALGITEAGVRQEATGVAAPLGLLGRLMGGQAGADTCLDAETLAVLADAAVLHPANAVPGRPEVAQEGAAVRRALDHLAAGDAEAALAALAHIPRNSPFADWRLFVRGLAAYYRQDDAEMEASWSRLAPNRAPAKIARALEALREWLSGDSPTLKGLGPAEGVLLEVEKGALGESVLSRLCQLHVQAAEGDWEGAFRTLRTLPRTAGPRDVPVVLPAAQAVMASSMKQGGWQLMERLTGWLPGPPDDPHWHRAWALYHELAPGGSLESAARHWIGYIPDIDQGGYPPEDQRLAKALVWHRAGKNYLLHLRKLDEGEDDEDEDEEDVRLGQGESWGRIGPGGEVQERLLAAALAALNKSIELAPELTVPYRDLAGLFRRWDQPHKAAETYRRLLERHPDSLEDLVSLAELLVDEGQPIEACVYARQAHQLKPLDRKLTELLWRCLVESARCYGMRQQWEESRAMLAEAARLDLSPEKAGIMPAFQAVLAFKAGDLTEARSLVWQAVKKAPHPAFGYLAMAIQASRWELPEHVVREFDSQWIGKLEGGFSSKAAGAMAQLLSRVDEWGDARSVTAGYVRRAIDYIARGVKCRWDREDLLAACDLLIRRLDWLAELESQDEDPPEADSDIELSEEFAQLENLARTLSSRGTRLFPEEPRFFAYLGHLLLAEGPLFCDRPYLRYVFQQLHALTQDASDPELQVFNQRASTVLEVLGPGPVSSKPQKPLDSRERHFFLQMISQALEGLLDGSEEFPEGEDDEEDERAPSPRRKRKR